MSSNQKQVLVALTLMPEWQTFIQMLDNWKYLIVQKGFTYGKTEMDLISIRAQIKNIAVFKTFQNKYKHLYEKPQELTEDDPATTIPLN